MTEPVERNADGPKLGEEAGRDFFAGEQRILGDLAGSSGFNFKRADQWSIDPDNGEATFDIKFFQEKGYTPSQALFGALHEIRCHLVETAEILDREGGPQEYAGLKSRSKVKPRIHIWENCRTDAKGNLAILGFAPSLDEDVRAVYGEKLFPQTDLTDKPKHLQFAYAVLRQAMLPGEPVVIDPAVQEAIDGLRNVKGKDVIDLATNPDQDPLLALRISKKFIEPIIDKLYREDLEDRKNSQQQEGQQNGQGQGQGQSGEPFEADYQDYEENIHPEPMDDADADEKIKAFKESQSEDARQTSGYETEHGVSKTDTDDYFREYRVVEPYIEPVREIFRRLTEERQVVVRHMASLKEEGVMIDPGLVAQTYLDVRSGVQNPKTMKDFEGTVVAENIPGKAYVYWLYDQSTSMSGQKAILQRRGAIIAAEALFEGDDMLNEAQLPDPLSLDIFTGFYGFGTPQPEGVSVYKPMSKGLTERQRIDLFKKLLEFGSIGTNDYDGLVEIKKDIMQRMNSDPTFASDIRTGKRRVCVIVTTDGGSNYRGLDEQQARTQTKGEVGQLRAIGAKVKAIAMAPTGNDKTHIQEVYGKNDTSVCEKESEYPDSINAVLIDVLDSLTIPGTIESGSS